MRIRPCNHKHTHTNFNPWKVMSGGIITLNLMRREFSNCISEFQQSLTPQPDWLVVTIDYHS